MAIDMTAAAAALQIAPVRRSIVGTPRRAFALLRVEGRGLDTLPGRRWLVYAAAVAVGIVFGAIRPGIERFYPESALFISLALAFGLIGRIPAALVVLAYVVADGAWFISREDAELDLLPGRIIGWILLWVLVGVVPRFARQTAATIDFGRGASAGAGRPIRALIAGLLLAAAVFGFMQLMAYLIGPAYRSRNPGIPDIKVFQVDSLFIAPLAGLVLAAIELRLRERLGRDADAIELLPTFPAFSILGVLFRIASFALVVFLFRGIISALPDVLVLVAAFAIGEVGAFIIGRSARLSATLLSIPSWARAGIGLLGTMAVGYVLYLGRGGAFSVTEYFTWVVAIGIGYVLMRLLFATAGREPAHDPGSRQAAPIQIPPSAANLAVVLGLFALFAVAPSPVLADNCTGFFDCIGAALLAALAALAAAAAFIWNFVKSVFTTLPPVISELEPLASEEGAQAQNDAITMLKNRVAMNALSNGDTDRADAIRAMSNGEFAQAAARGEFQ